MVLPATAFIRQCWPYHTIAQSKNTYTLNATISGNQFKALTGQPKTQTKRRPSVHKDVIFQKYKKYLYLFTSQWNIMQNKARKRKEELHI